MTRLFKNILILGGAITIILPARAQTRMDQSKCREMALEHSREIKITDNKIEQARLGKSIARAGHLPSLNATGMFFYKPDDLEYSIEGGNLPTFFPDEQGELQPNYQRNPETGKLIIGHDGNPIFEIYAMLPDPDLSVGLEGVTMGGLRVEQPVYMGGKIRAANEKAETGIEMAGLHKEMTTAEILARADEAFYEYISVKAKKEAAREYKILLDSLVSSIEASMEEGMTTRNDLLKARVRRNEAILMVQKAQSGQELARMNLCRITGLPLNTSISIDGDTSVPEEIKPETDKDKSHEPTSRPEFKMLNKAIEMGEQEEKIIRSEMLPQLGVSAGYSYFGGLELNGRGAEDMAFSTMASLKIPIFNWSEKRNKLSKTRLETEAAQMKMNDAEEKMQLEIARARFNLQDAFTRLELTRQALEQAEENREESRERFEEGMERLVNLLEAQAQWQEAKSDHIEAQTEVKIKHTKYLKTTGQL
ncbi:MAG: TolC family protein, partial [Marinilabiliaceae bacterium]